MRNRIVVEWTRGSIRLALAERRGGRMRLRELRAQPSIGAEIAPSIRALLGKGKPGTSEVIAVLPREQVITRVVRFPATDHKELAQMVELYGKAQMPYPREQMVMDFSIVDQQNGFSTIAIVACQRETVDRQLGILRDAGLPPAVLTISSWGVLGWYQHSRNVNGRALGSAEATNEPVLVVNIDDTRTDLVLIANQRVLSSRSVNQGVEEWESSGEAVELLIAEVERSRAAIRKELPNLEIRSLTLTGLGDLSTWVGQLSQRLGLSVEAQEVHASFDGLKVLAVPISSVVSAGIACSDLRGCLDLSPPELRLQLHDRRQVKQLVTLGTLLLSVLLLGAGLLGVQVLRERRVASQLDWMLGEIGTPAKHLQEHSRSSQLVSATLQGRRQLATMLSSIFERTPSAVTLESLTFEGTKREVVLRGHATTTQEVLEYINQLKAVQGIRDVRLKYSTRRSTPNGERTDFELALSGQERAS